MFQHSYAPNLVRKQTPECYCSLGTCIYVHIYQSTIATITYLKDRILVLKAKHTDKAMYFYYVSLLN